jgi:capsular polysaccharide export protein
LFLRLGQALSRAGCEVHRINLSGGDHSDWPRGAVNFRGRFSDWPVFFDKFLRENGITDLMLFGDCRPYHVSALGIASLRNVKTHVLEEGYLRPHWMTLEREGVNARSTLSRDKNWFLEEARKLPPEPDLPPITASFRRRARDAYLYYQNVVTGRLMFPHYRSHRPGWIGMEAIGWAWRYVTRGWRERDVRRVLERVSGRPLFLVPLQLSNDFQIRAHSPFPDMESAASYIIESFAANAPPDTLLLLKAHPLDCSFTNWRGFVRNKMAALGLQDRLYFADGGLLDDMVEMSSGLICVNSTSATIALGQGKPVCTVGEAIYDLEGLTHQDHLDTFWRCPTKPEPGLYEAFRRVLVDRCLVRGGLASESAVSILVGTMARRLGVVPPRLKEDS